ncbi:MAG: hypothetical protein K8R86_09785 [Bacteroidales bacterium]|nr:hypothetical protein [Bacteroidales bacterium]
MSEIKSDMVNIESSQEKIYSYLIDFNNFGELMPEQVINWQSTIDTCSFSIKGMADLSLRMGQKNEFSFISYVSDGNKPFAFSLNSHIQEKNDSTSEVQIILNADLNPMLKMMAARPLQNFVNLLVQKLKEVVEKSD